jgi:hypothetical protein
LKAGRISFYLELVLRVQSSSATMSIPAAGASDGSPMKSAASSNCTVVASSTCRRQKDPVSLYQKYRDSWEKQKPPGTDSRLKLRWDIREQFYNQHDHEDAAGGADKDKVKSDTMLSLFHATVIVFVCRRLTRLLYLTDCIDHETHLLYSTAIAERRR